MAKIKLLSDTVIGRIAAGEVVERPSAAAKELIENSLDAGATAVTVEIREGGLDYLRVTDNGCGIEPADIRMAFERHATSKITRETDLDAIATLGFRGEALASIAAVGRVTMTTRARGNEIGLKAVNEGGTLREVAEAACPAGTTIVVRDLFFNAPVRRGFMKKPAAEAGAIGDLMMRMILSRPDVSFRFLSNGKVVYHSPGDGKAASAVLAVYGREAMKQLREVRGHEGGLVLSGYVGIGELARGNRTNECFCINRRVMFSALLSSALETACRERVMIGKYPVCALNLEIPYEAVDVNVHPNKLEVRFRDEAAVSEAVTSLVLEALKDRDAFEKPVEMKLVREPAAGTPAIPSVPSSPAERGGDVAAMSATGAENVAVMPAFAASPTPAKSLPPPAATVMVSKTIPQEAEEKEFWRAEPVFRPVTPTVSPAEPAVESLPLAEPVRVFQAPPAEPRREEAVPASPPEAWENPFRQETVEQVDTIRPMIQAPMRVFGALFHTFILIEYADQLLLVDQHAVHERLLFDRMMAAWGSGVASQELLVPHVLPVTRQEQALLEQNRELLEGIGLVVESFGETDVAIRAIPMLLGEPETDAFVRELIGELEAGKAPGFEKKRAMILQTACKHAVKGGEALPEEVLRALAQEMIDQRVTPTCPHGRPLVVAITHQELDRKFKRIQ